MYVIQRGPWCDISTPNIHAKGEDKTDYVKDSLYIELECVFDKFPKHQYKLLLGDFKAKVGMGNIFKPTFWKGSLNEITVDHGVTVLNFATCKYLASQKSVMFLHYNIA
jgi:hypothetical protein